MITAAAWGARGAGMQRALTNLLHLAELLHRSRQRLHERIGHAQQILDRIDEFETTHSAHVTADDLCSVGDLCGCDLRA